MTQATVLQNDAASNVESLRAQLPGYARDTRLNLGIVLTDDGAPDLSRAQILGVALASAYATRQADVIRAVAAEAAEVLSEAETEAAKAAAAVMAMNNVYYRFMHEVEDAELQKLPPKLRMNIIGTHGIAKADFELYCLAVSAINGCGACLASHEKTLRKHGLSAQPIQSAARI
ncbi:MAG: carboxymuconolactone decarboxylase family protein, partial [Alphaproteobacteria bacterium]|nr:carboxymuconolactone decarboxylase family protein [Alphaproteobacteria bacterium]